MSDSIVEQTYQALVSVVQTTAVTRKVLRRPPFTFLHKLLVETIGDSDVFTPAQLDFSALKSKEDKARRDLLTIHASFGAAFLTRALAFVTFAMANAKEQCVSCLLLVSPVKVLAGVAVDDTLEFLLQLCVVCKSVDRDAKEAAVQQVLQKGDELLYKSSVSFRRGIVLIQAVIRTFIRRRVGKRRALEMSEQSQTSRIPMAVGTRFLKELPHGFIYDGVIHRVLNNRYTLVYDQDPEARDEVDEIEMRIILEESQRLAMYRDRISESGRRISKRRSKRSDDVDISLTSLPDLSSGLSDTPVRQGPGSGSLRGVRRISSGDSGAALLAPKMQHPVLMRALSQRPTKPNQSYLDGGRFLPTAQSTAALPVEPAISSRALVGLVRAEPTGIPTSETASSSRAAAPSDDAVAEGNQSLAFDSEGRETESSTWQASLKKMLDDGRQKDPLAPQSLHEAASPKREANIKGERQSETFKTDKTSAVFASATSSRTAAAHMPNFPKLSIPGTKSLMPSASKRRANEVVAATAPTSHGKSKVGNAGRSSDRSGDTTAETSAQPPSTPDGSSANPNSGRHRLHSMVSFRGPAVSEPPADSAFTSTYHSTDQKTQEKLAFIREIVMHIDSYMKRKRLRVIDLFRFCDSDGNGSISPDEMIETLSQMEIRLTPEQGADFINYIDKDGNGSIDVDELEELVRVARRTDAHREQLKHVSKRNGGDAKAPSKFAAVVKARPQILDAFKTAQQGDGEPVSSSNLRLALLSLPLPNVDDACIDRLIERAAAKTNSGSNGASSGASVAGANAGASAPTTSGASATVTYAQLAKALDELEWARKPNRFLSQAWIAQFDAQMERAARDFDLL